MRVNVDAAGNYQHAAGVDNLFTRCSLQIRPDFFDEFAFDANVGRARFVGGDYGSIADDHERVSPDGGDSSYKDLVL